MIRITGGEWNRRKLGTPRGAATRPTPARVRQALFNVFGDAGWAEARENANVDVAEPASLTTRWLDEELTTQTFASSDVVRANLEQWADAVERRGDYRFTRDQKLHNVEILEAIVRSAESGEEVVVR